jgi:hypothetical protein
MQRAYIIGRVKLRRSRIPEKPSIRKTVRDRA